MENELHLSKHHGLRNDFLILLDMAEKVNLGDVEIVALLDRRIGVGADGLIRVTPPSAESLSVAKMELYNSDGSRAEMSGNGIRCLAQALIKAGLAPRDKFSIDTEAGAIEIESHSKVGSIEAIISVGMGRPDIKESSIRRVGKFEFSSVRVDIGNPHLVLIPSGPFTLEDLSSLDIATIGPFIESEYSDGVNVEWILPISRDELFLRVWERGAGVTEACGTGTTASAYVANSLGIVDCEMTVHNPGGDLKVRVTDDQCYLTGPAQHVCDVQVSLDELRAMAALPR